MIFPRQSVRTLKLHSFSTVMRGLDPRIHQKELVLFDGLPGQARQ
jgi:hypothetical protein